MGGGGGERRIDEMEIWAMFGARATLERADGGMNFASHRCYDDPE